MGRDSKELWTHGTIFAKDASSFKVFDIDLDPVFDSLVVSVFFLRHCACRDRIIRHPQGYRSSVFYKCLYLLRFFITIFLYIKNREMLGSIRPNVDNSSYRFAFFLVGLSRDLFYFRICPISRGLTDFNGIASTVELLRPVRSFTISHKLHQFVGSVRQSCD